MFFLIKIMVLHCFIINWFFCAQIAFVYESVMCSSAKEPLNINMIIINICSTNHMVDVHYTFVELTVV